MPGNPDMQKIFKRAIAIAKELRAKDPKLKLGESTKKAWQTPEIKKMKAEYDKKHPKK